MHQLYEVMCEMIYIVKTTGGARVSEPTCQFYLSQF